MEDAHELLYAAGGLLKASHEYYNGLTPILTIKGDEKKLAIRFACHGGSNGYCTEFRKGTLKTRLQGA